MNTVIENQKDRCTSSGYIFKVAVVYKTLKRWESMLKSVLANLLNYGYLFQSAALKIKVPPSLELRYLQDFSVRF